MTAGPVETSVNDAYLRQVQRQLRVAHLGILSNNRTSLEALYARAPSTSRISVAMRSGRPERWAAHDRNPIAAALVNEMLAGRAHDRLKGLYGEICEDVSAVSTLDIADVRAPPLPLSPLDDDGVKLDAFSISLRCWVDFFDRIVMLGPPGSGKSTFAKHLALTLASGADGELLPVYVECRRLVNATGWPDDGVDGITSAALLEYLERRFLKDADAQSRSALRDAVEEGRIVLILDGLDEVHLPAGDDAVGVRRAQFQHFIDVVEGDYAPAKILVTSRDYAYSGWHLRDFVEASLGEFQRPQVYEVARAIIALTPSSATESVDRLTQRFVALLERAVPADLRARPLFINLLVQLYLKRAGARVPALPVTPTELYEESVKLFLNRWVTDPTESLTELLGCTVDQLRERVEAVAYFAQEAAGQDDNGEVASGEPFGEALLLEQLTKIPERVSYRDIVAYLNREAGLIVSPESGQFAFAHRAFQEYLAACHLARADVRAPAWQAIPDMIAGAAPLWRETLRHLGLMLSRDGRYEDLWRLCDLLVPDPEVKAHPTESPWLTWLGATYVDALLHEAAGVAERRNRVVLDGTLAAIERVDVTSPELPLPERCEIWNIRGRIRAVRARQRNEPPEYEWCEIPRGPFRLGLDMTEASRIGELRGQGSWLPDRETPAHEVSLETFSIGRWPVTRREFARFLLASDGYANERLWRQAWLLYRVHDLAACLTDPYGAEAPDRPRTEVSWHESAAYCAWLSHTCGRAIRLPTEPEWEKAARGCDARMFPWGDAYRADACNGEDAGLDNLTAVGCFSSSTGYWADRSPGDMAGNCWEWCSTVCEIESGARYAYPYDANDGREDLDAPPNHLRVVRGGCYVSPPHQLAVTFRGRDRPTARMFRQGFRVVMAGNLEEAP